MPLKITNSPHTNAIKGAPKIIIKFIRNVSLGAALLIACTWAFFTQPSCRSSQPIDLDINEQRLEEIVRKLSVEFYPRSFNHINTLDDAAAYIEKHFREAGGIVEIQEYQAVGHTYKNVRCFFGDRKNSRLVIGAHYDSHDHTPGADDNASGIAGLIELAYLFGQKEPTICIELVAYTLEEPPFFGTDKMGSYQHAESLANEGVEIIGMIALEMIGYFTDERGSQKYPSPLLKLLYPSRGNFIAVVGNLDQRSFIADVKAGMKGATDLKVYSISAPTQIPGIDFSDHRSYWAFDYPALMLTDTAFYRNTAYHTSDDTWDRLDYSKMADVVRAVYNYVTSD